MKTQATSNSRQGTESGDGLRDLVRGAVPPIGNSDRPECDLWPAMRQRINQEAFPRREAVPWFDWALAGALFLLVAVSPGLVPVLLYYL